MLYHVDDCLLIISMEFIFLNSPMRKFHVPFFMFFFMKGGGLVVIDVSKQI